MLPPLFIGGVGGPEMVVLFMLVVLLFGANKLPELARAGGEAMGEFQKGRERIETEISDATRTTTTTAATVDADAVSDVDAAAGAVVDPDVEADTDHEAASA